MFADRTENAEFDIRPMTGADLPRVLLLEGLCHSHPWTADMFRKELENPVSRIALLFEGMSLIGYVCYWLVFREVHILNIAVSPLYRRMGAASRMLGSILNSPGAMVDRAFLEVRKGNDAALKLYEAFGFRRTGIRFRYYPDGEDAVLMTWEREAANDGQKNEIR